MFGNSWKLVLRSNVTHSKSVRKLCTPHPCNSREQVSVAQGQGNGDRKDIEKLLK